MSRIALSDRASTAQALRVVRTQSYPLALLLLCIAIVVNAALQPNFFRPGVINGNLQTYLPLMLLAVGQTVVIIGGGVDLSIGAIVSLVNVVIVRVLGTTPTVSQIVLAIVLGLLVGMIAGGVNGICVAYLRFQPIVTTFATSFIFSGTALAILSSPGGTVPSFLMDAYQSSPFGIPLTLWVMLVVLLLWWLVRSTRYGPYLYAVGGRSLSAYATGVPVSLVRLSTYTLAGLLAAAAALTLVLGTGTGDPLIGNPMTLSSIVAVVLGGTRLSGGQGGIFGSLLGVIILGLILNIISFANVPTWWQTLVNGSIIVLALAGPGIFALLRRRV